MSEIICGQCAASFELPHGYAEPMIQCPICGSHQKNSAYVNNEPVYRILDQAGRKRASEGVVSELPEVQPPPPVSGPSVVAPALASAEKKQAQVSARLDHRLSGRPISERKILEDALGRNGMEMLLQLVAGYMDELNESSRRAEKAKAIQKLMKAKFPAELVARAVEFAEKSPEINDILWNNSVASLKRGLAVLGAGALIAMVVHLAAHPGRELVFFQLPFAVGLALVCNALIGMAGLKNAALRSNKVHYGFLCLASLLILGYVVWGVFF